MRTSSSKGAPVEASEEPADDAAVATVGVPAAPRLSEANDAGTGVFAPVTVAVPTGAPFGDVVDGDVTGWGQAATALPSRAA